MNDQRREELIKAGKLRREPRACPFDGELCWCLDEPCWMSNAIERAFDELARMIGLPDP